MILTQDPTPSLLLQRTQAERFRPTAASVFRAAVAEGFHQTSLVAGFNLLALAPRDVEDEDKKLEEDEWRASEFHRKGLKFFEGMTTDQAALLAERHDERTRRQFVLSRSEGNVIPLIAGSLIGGIPDPLNFIPIFGPAARVGAISRIAVTALEAGLGALATQPFLVAQAKAFGEDFDLQMAAENVAAAVVIGGGFGAIGAGLSRLPVGVRALATRKAAQDMIEGKPVDVGEVLGNRVDGTELVRARLNERAAPGEVLARLNERLGDNLDSEALTARTMQTLRKPNMARSADEKALAEALDVTPEAMRALDIADRPRASAEDKRFLEAFKRGDELGFLKSKLTSAEQMARSLEARLSLRKSAKVSAALVETRAEVDLLRGRVGELEAGLELDHSIARPEEPVLPQVEPTRESNIGRIEEPELEGLNARIVDLEAEGRMTPEAQTEIRAGDEVATRSETYAKAYERAAGCLLR